jgi:hypothetical protein
MTDKFIKEQIRVIEKATANASQSKETAIKFLKDAGILSRPEINSSSAKTSDKKNK